MDIILKRLIIVFLALLGGITLSFAQESNWRDTLQAAIKTEKRRVEISMGRLQTGLEGIRSVVSPMGEGDPIRWAQGLPGVATGADGTTAMYVRGGNSGNNLFSLDGIPVYGYSHILGLTTIVPTNVIESAVLGKGGFDGAESNFTAAHLRIVTKQPSDTWKASIALNNFLASAHAEGPIGKRLSFLLSARVSPLSWEYKAVRSALPDLLGGLDNFKADVGDVYAKLHWQKGANCSLDASFLGSLDRYGFDTPDASHEVMGWKNMVGTVRFRLEWEQTKMELTASANHYGSSQEQEKLFRETDNFLSLQSGLTEYSLQGGWSHKLSDWFTISEGIITRYAQFAPGQVTEDIKRTHTALASLWFQAEYSVPDQLALKAAIRGNYFRNYTIFPFEIDMIHRDYWQRAKGERMNPEISVSAKWNITRHIALEATADRMVQYYHTLEGLPVGWSLDLIVPTGEKVLPETSWQGGVGLSTRFGNHSASVGGFYKQMKNLVYFKYSQGLFNGALAHWERLVELGNGRSFGLEALYEFQQEDWYARVSYTLSKTTREDFPSFYGGRPFHARFDRRHMLNATAQWKGISATLILQSGHWEHGAAETYELPSYDESYWTANYYSGVNNYHMPTVFRLDLGYQFQFKTGRMEHTVNMGVCNATNHFNPFMLYFDTRTESWKEIALLPILPNFSYRLSF